MTPISIINRIGFPAIESISNTLTTTASTYTFNKHQSVMQYFEGGVFIKLTNTPTAPSTAVPVMFATQGVTNSSVPVYDSTGAALTTSTISGDGIYIAFVDGDKVYLLNN